jgi:pyrrolidone-carboxylate peptidase
MDKPAPHLILSLQLVQQTVHDVIADEVSQTAGTFVCNHVMYGLLHKLQGQNEVRGGFIH